ncbi:hypothetical protein E3T40_15430 [Cryobacterium sp. TMT1-19]|nr:hypothetical protein [Cryobacterium sp. TMT1-19]TFD30382.1 hypothetical protein E3T40_15430 [Cryobacterium sp. TMT1-19]
MMNAKRPDPKPLEPRQAAARLSIATKDLPNLGRPWTRADVQALQAEKPAWLTEARRRLGAAVKARRRAEYEKVLKLSRRIQDAGWVTANDGTNEAIPLYDSLALRAHHEWGVKLDLAEEAVDTLLPQTSGMILDDKATEP